MNSPNIGEIELLLFHIFLHAKLDLLQNINFNVWQNLLSTQIVPKVEYHQKLQNYVFNLTHDTACSVAEHLWSMKGEFIGNTIKAELFAEGVHGLF